LEDELAVRDERIGSLRRRSAGTPSPRWRAPKLLIPLACLARPPIVAAVPPRSAPFPPQSLARSTARHGTCTDVCRALLAPHTADCDL